MDSNQRLDEAQEVEGEKAMKQVEQSNQGSDEYRMWAAISFSVVLIVVGVPLWWRTTEVYRAPLPHREISLIEPSNIRILTRVFISTQYPTLFNTLSRDLMVQFKHLSLLDVEIKPFKIGLDEVNISSVEVTERIPPKEAGVLLLVQVPHIEGDFTITVSNRRIIYFTSSAKTKSICEIILNWMFEESELKNKMNSILLPTTVPMEKKTTRLKASLSYDLIFTVMNSDPFNVKIDWDIKESIQKYVEPLLDQISSVGRLNAKSQWQYLVNLNHLSVPDEGNYVIKFDDLAHIITPLEARLGSGVSAVGCIHMVLYVPDCGHSPLWFVSEKNKRTTWMVSPSWGAVQVLNPSSDNCQNHTSLRPNAVSVMSIFVSQLHSLLGFNKPAGIPGVGVLKRKGSLLTEWQLDSLYRMRCVEQLTSASLTLQSLAKLLGEISNIVINEEVAKSVHLAVENIELAKNHLKSGNLKTALEHSTLAFKEAERAFSDPSLLALLYFPDDQKYAVYIPLFLPIMIPVLMSLEPIYKWLRVSQGKSSEK